MRNRIALVAGLLLALGAFAPSALAGTARTSTYVHVFVDCVTQSPGTYDATFGYKNDNSTAQTVLVGSDNYFTPPPDGRGQTTTFQPGTVHNAFTVKAIPNATKLTWTVSLNGRTESVSVSPSSSHACTTTSPAIHISVDCVTKNATTYDATFAYTNDNAAAQTIAVGTDNFFSPPPDGRGQTTVFQPGSHHAAFTVTGIPNATKLMWTVAFGGRTDTATASSSGRSCTPTVKQVEVFVDCVTRGSATYDATFGYENENATAQTIAVGSDNFFSPPPDGRGQTTIFQPGSHHAAFTVTGIPNATKLMWTVAFGGRTDTATASSSSRSCTPKVKRVEVFVDCVTRGSATYDATFGYENENAAVQTIAVGTDNYFTPLPIDRVQTTAFQPGKVHGAFTVKAIPNGTKLVWTVNSGGKTDTATARSDSRSCTPKVKRVEVFVDCVTRGSATYEVTFGYENENAAVQTIAVGTDNYFTPLPIDRVQTTAFQPGEVHGAFIVKGVPNGTKLVWTVNSGGKTDTATTTGHGRSCAPTTPPAKVTICHRSDSKWVLITVDPSSLADHLRRGDVLPGPTGCPTTPVKKHHHHHHHRHHHEHGDDHANNQAHQERRR